MPCPKSTQLHVSTTSYTLYVVYTGVYHVVLPSAVSHLVRPSSPLTEPEVLLLALSAYGKFPPLSTHFCRANTHLLRTLRGGGEQASHTHTQHVPHSHTRCTCCALILCFLCEPPPSLPYSVNDSNDSNGENGENGEHGQHKPFQVRRGSRCCTQFLCVLLCPMLCTRERVLGLLC